MTRVGKYELLDLLGKGGMGEVWRARDTELDCVVALKLLQRTDAEDLARFKREAHVVAKLNHPHVAQIYEFSFEPPYLAMQFVEGAPLDESPADRIAALRDAARGVHHAHQNGILHRDLKPANIMVDASGRSFVLDFGLAREVKGEQTAMSLSGDILGTPSYMSPEQARGEVNKLDARTDVYGLGATLYCLIAGRPPFTGPTAFEVVFKVLNEDPLPGGGNRDLELIALKAMDKAPARRYATADEFADDLDRYLRREPILARPASTLYRLKKRIQKAPLVWGLGTLLVLAIAAGVGYGWKRTLQHLESERQGRLQAEDALRAKNLAAAVDRALALLGELDDLTYAPDVSWKSIEPKAREMLSRVDEGLKDFPREAKLWYYRGKALGYLGEEAGAEAAYTKAIGLDPLDGRSSYERAMIYMDRFHEMLIGRDEEELWAKRKGARQWLEKAKDDLTRAGSSAAKGERAAAEVWGLYAEYKYEEAAQAASDRIPGGGRTEGYLLVRALARTFRGRGPEAIADLTAALDRRPGLWQARFHRGNRYRRLGRHDEAIADFTAVLSINPKFAVAHVNRGTVYGHLKRYDEALADLTAAISIDPNLAMAYLDRGCAYMELKRHDEALADYASALSIDPAYSTAHNGRGIVYRNLRRYDEALAAFGAALSVDREDPTAHFNRAVVYMVLQRYDEALADYGAALALKPNYAAAYENRAGVYYTLRRYDEALADYASALSIEKDAQTYYNRASVYKALHRDDEALADYGSALTLDPNYAPAYNNRGNLLIVLGRYREAVADLETALRVSPEDWPGRPKAEKNLEDARAKLEEGDF